MITQSPNSTTTNLRNVAANLRHIANLIDPKERSGDLAVPVQLHVSLLPMHGYDEADCRATVDGIAEILGVEADWERTVSGSTYGYYRAEIKQERSWTVSASSYGLMPDPAEEIRAENERLRAKLAEIERIAGDQP